MRALVLILLCLATLILELIHSAHLVPPKNLPKVSQVKSPLFISKDQLGIHQIVVKGSAFERGLQVGKTLGPLLELQERTLEDQLNQIIPSRYGQTALFIFFMGWFRGLESYLEEEWMVEMYGVSQFAPRRLDHFADPYTRQLGYHGLHEVGQMAVDSGYDGPACTQIGVKKGEGWVIGRNFDFEAGRVFDEEKLMKWVFPEKGIPYLSVMFSGMVGAVTGVNAQGVYIAMNAAGSEDFVRLGTPSTLLATKVLQEARTAEEGVEILKRAKALITDIFVVGGARGPIYQVEKTPKRTRVLSFDKEMGVGNHLVHPDFQEDRVNRKRIHRLTTMARHQRAVALADKLGDTKDDKKVEAMLAALRDKSLNDQVKLHLGHRKAIDGLIATHGVIYDSHQKQMFVSRGPSLVNSFLGFDLKKSFAEQRPVLLTKSLPSDPEVTEELYLQIKSDIAHYKKSIRRAKDGDCSSLDQTQTPHYLRELAQGHISICRGDRKAAREFLLRAQAQHPAYLHEVKALEERL